MNTKLQFLALLFASIFALGQVPQGISYQAIAFNSNGNPVNNGNVGIRISILDNSVNGTAVYVESHNKTTNAQGLFNLNIGEGTPINSTFSNINWATNTKFLKVEIDPNGGSNYSIVGTNQLMSVPYALMAGSLNSTTNTNTISLKNNSGNGCVVVYSSNEARGYYLNSNTSGSGQWTNSSVSFSNPIKGAIASNNTIVVYSDNEAKGYYLNPNSSSSGQWTSSNVTFSNPIKGAIASNNSIIIYSDNEAKGYYINPNTSSSGQWTDSNVTFSNSIKGAVSGNNTIVVFSNNEAKGYYVNTNTAGSGQWTNSFPTFSSEIRGGFVSGNSIVIYSDTEVKGYYLNENTSGSGQWTSTNPTFPSGIKGGISTGR